LEKVLVRRTGALRYKKRTALVASNGQVSCFRKEPQVR